MQRHCHQPRTTTAHRRSGLAPLEMVLLTPFLVLMGALMVCFGDAALWKIRAQATVHYQATQTESFRDAHYDASSWMNPRPANWPPPAIPDRRGGNNINAVQNLYWNQTGPEDVAALQGNRGGGRTTSLIDPYRRNRFVVNRKMTADRGVHAGRAVIRKKFPMLRRALSSDGRFRIDHDMEVLNGDWYFADVGLGWNGDRRAEHLYDIDPNKIPQLNRLWNDFQTAFHNLKANPNKEDLDFLDNDREWLIYHPNARRPRDFHPRPSGCEIDLLEYVTSGAYENYLNRIRGTRTLDGVPMRMAKAWYSTYRGEWLARQNPNYTPKGPLSDEELRSRFTRLQNYINLLHANGFGTPLR